MIYHHNFAGISGPFYREAGGYDEVSKKRLAKLRAAGITQRSYDLLAVVADKIKSNDKDSHVFITTKNQEEAFEKFIKDGELEEWVSYKMPYYVTNPVHPGVRNLRLCVFQSPNHPQRSN